MNEPLTDDDKKRIDRLQRVIANDGSIIGTVEQAYIAGKAAGRAEAAALCKAEEARYESLIDLHRKNSSQETYIAWNEGSSVAATLQERIRAAPDAGAMSQPLVIFVPDHLVAYWRDKYYAMRREVRRANKALEMNQKVRDLLATSNQALRLQVDNERLRRPPK